MAVGTAGSSGAGRRLIFMLLATALAGCETEGGLAPGAEDAANAAPTPISAEPASDFDQAIDAQLAEMSERSSADPEAGSGPNTNAEQDDGSDVTEHAAAEADAVLASVTASDAEAKGVAREAPHSDTEADQDNPAPSDAPEVAADETGALVRGSGEDAGTDTPEPGVSETDQAGASRDPSADLAVIQETAAVPQLPPVDPALYSGEFDGRLDERLELVPEEFAARGDTRWNGARTLAGIWIAHPAAARTMRARIFNLSTGRAADGAIFRREGMAPDAPLQISSDAAQALGMRVNRTSEIVIVALRQPEPAARPLAETAPVVRLEIEPPAQAAPPEPAQEPAEEPSSVDADTSSSGDADTSAATRDEPDAGTSESTSIVRAEPTDPTTSPVKARSVEPDSGPGKAPDLHQGPGGDTPESADTTPRPPSAEISEPVPESARGGDADAEVPAPSDEAAEAARGQEAINFIQVGIFALRENSDRLIARLAEAKVPASTEQMDRAGRVLVRVIAGPFGNEIERDRALRVIEDLGIRDARLIRE